MKTVFSRFVRDESGQDLTEYAVLVAFIAMVVYLGVTAFGTNLDAWWDRLATFVNGMAPAPAA